MNHAAKSPTVKVIKDERRGGFEVHYTCVGGRGRVSNKKFFFKTNNMNKERKEKIDENLLRNIMKNKVLAGRSHPTIFRMKPYEVKSELAMVVRKIGKSKHAGKLMSDYGFGQKEAEKSEGVIDDSKEEKGEEGEQEGRQYPDPLLPKNKSIFAAEEESANTKVFLAPSFSGKTTLMVEELNKLSTKELDKYDKILLFTESTAAAPLKKIDKHVRKKMMIYDRMVPQFIRILKKINTITKNKFRFLLLMDDCLNLKGDILIKLILTLRNSNISSVISIQYSKLLAKSQRQSIHDYFIINMKEEDLEYMMSGFLAPHFRDLFEKEGLARREVINKMNFKRLAEHAKIRLKDRLLHFDQRHDQILIYSRTPKPKT